MSRAEIGGTLDFPDIITPDPFQMAYQSKHHASQSDMLSAWNSQMQEKKDTQRRSRKELIAADNAYLSVLQDKENQEVRNQRQRSAKAKEVQYAALKQYQSEREKQVYDRKIRQMLERHGMLQARAQAERKNEELKALVERNVKAQVLSRYLNP